MQLKSEIDATVQTILPNDQFYQRTWFDVMDDGVAIEVLRAALATKQISATRPQLQEFLSAIRTYSPGKQFNLPGNRLVKLHKDHFML